MNGPPRWLWHVLVAIACVSLLRDAPAAAQRFQSLAFEDGDKGCTISATPVSFGSYDVTRPSPLTGLGTITFSCGTHARTSPRTPVKDIRIELSRGNSGSFDRAMTQGSDRLRYNLFLDAAATRIWGDGSQGTVVYSLASPQNNQTYTVTMFGRVVEMQDVPPGLYQDSLTATILF